jgi:hypothetical protein
LAVFSKLLLLLLLSVPFNVIIVPSETFWSGPALAIYWLGGQHQGGLNGVVVIAGAVLFSFIVVMLLFILGDCC